MNKLGRSYLGFKQTLLRYRRKIQVFDIYENKCACCGESNLFFLDLDHVNNDGNMDKHAGPNKVKNKHNGYRWSRVRNAVIANPERFQILCSNCNVGKARNGGVCPHKSGSVPTWYVADIMYGA